MLQVEMQERGMACGHGRGPVVSRSSGDQDRSIESGSSGPVDRLESRSVRSRIWRFVRLPVFVYAGILVVMMLLENRLLFPAARYPAGDWSAAARLGLEEVYLSSADGTRLHGWYADVAAPRGYVLYCHGNAGNVTGRGEVADYFRRRYDLATFVIDYRGYGRSEGRPSGDGVLADARAARQWLAARAGVPQEEIILVGRSLGGAVAVDLAAREGARCLVLQGTFTSVPDVAAELYPWLPVRWFLRTQLNSLAKIPQCRAPLLISHAEHDELISVEHGRRLYEAAAAEFKQFVLLGNQGHNDPMPPEYYDSLGEFLDRVLEAPVREFHGGA